jgi:hypothetical protein
MLKIRIETVPSEEQRYPTIGDYWDEPDGTREVRVTDMGDPRYEFLVAVHELVELMLCAERGIAEPEIMAFDVAFEEERDRGLHGPDDEPGDDPRAPYRREHRFAENIERLVAHELGVDWEAYGEAVQRALAEGGERRGA